MGTNCAGSFQGMTLPIRIPAEIPHRGISAMIVEAVNLPSSQPKRLTDVVKMISDIWYVWSRVAAAIGNEAKIRKPAALKY